VTFVQPVNDANEDGDFNVMKILSSQSKWMDELNKNTTTTMAPSTWGIEEPGILSIVLPRMCNARVFTIVCILHLSLNV